MKRLRLHLLSLFLLSAVILSAQTFQVKMGGGFSSLTGNSRVVGAYKFGVAYEYEFNQYFSFSPALSYYGKGWKDPDREVPFYTPEGEPEYDENGEQRMGVMNRSTTACYLELPLMFCYYIRLAERKYVVLSAGPYVAYGVNGKVTTKGDTSRPGSEKLYYEESTFSESGLHRFDTGMQWMAGYQMDNGLTIGLEGDIGFLKMPTRHAHPVSCILSLSYRLGW